MSAPDVLHDPARAFMPYPAVPVASASTGPLAGLRFGVKDLFHVAGYPTSMGQPVLAASLGIQTTTAPTVQRLLDAGAAFGGKTVSDEFAFSMTGNNAHYGAPINGAAPDRIAGGSSSGSAAAVSHRMVDFALGTDTGGSVRAPASHCGLVGLRPSHGRVSLDAGMALSPSLDTCGWFARDVPTFAQVANVLLAEGERALPDRVRLMAPRELWALATNPARKALAPARQKIESVWGPAKAVNVVLDDLEQMYWAFRYIQGREAWQVWGDFIQARRPTMGDAVAQRLNWSATVTDEQVAPARAFRQRFTAHLETLLGDDGVMVLPSMPDIAPLCRDSEASIEDYRNRAIRMLCVSGLSGLPQLSLPMAQRGGVPLGISLLGPRGSDRSLVRLAERLVALA